MSPKLEKFLFKTYPKLFPTGRNVDPKASLICFGLENGDGGFWIIHNLCAAIQSHIDGTSPKPDQVVVDQVKEKFGTLRFYFHGGDDTISGMVSFAEWLSGVTCEGCGNTDAQTIGRTTKCWYKTCCKGCIPKVLTNYPSVYKWISHADSAKAYARKKASEARQKNTTKSKRQCK